MRSVLLAVVVGVISVGCIAETGSMDTTDEASTKDESASAVGNIRLPVGTKLDCVVDSDPDSSFTIDEVGPSGIRFNLAGELSDAQWSIQVEDQQKYKSCRFASCSSYVDAKKNAQLDSMGCARALSMRVHTKTADGYLVNVAVGETPYAPTCHDPSGTTHFSKVFAATCTNRL